MLGSHNSLSYLPIKGWKKILKSWVQCQSLTIEEQYNKGVRYFDLRIRRDNKKNWWYCHNSAKFILMEPNDDIITFLIEKKVYVRILLDVRTKPKDAYNLKLDFLDLCDYLKVYEGLNVDSIIVYWEWEEYEKSKIQQSEYHSSVSAPWYQYILGTHWFAKHHNKDKINSEYLNNDNKVLMLDYVDELLI